MSVRFPTYAPFVLLFATIIAGCGHDAATPTEPAAASASKLMLTVEPVDLQPEFVLGSACGARSPYRLRLTVFAGGPGDVILRGLRFSFVDASGARLFPEVIPIPTPASPPVIPTPLGSPLPGAAALPGASVIPIPGSSPIHGLLVGGGRQERLPYDLRFGCGAPPRGVLVVTGDGADRMGRPHSSEVRARVGQ